MRIVFFFCPAKKVRSFSSNFFSFSPNPQKTAFPNIPQRTTAFSNSRISYPSLIRTPTDHNNPQQTKRTGQWGGKIAGGSWPRSALLFCNQKTSPLPREIGSDMDLTMCICTFGPQTEEVPHHSSLWRSYNNTTMELPKQHNTHTHFEPPPPCNIYGPPSLTVVPSSQATA